MERQLLPGLFALRENGLPPPFRPRSAPTAARGCSPSPRRAPAPRPSTSHRCEGRPLGARPRLALTRPPGRAHTFRRPFPGWTRSRTAADTGLPFSPSLAAAFAAAAGSPPACGAPPPGTAPFSPNLKGRNAQLNHASCNRARIRAPTAAWLLRPKDCGPPTREETWI